MIKTKRAREVAGVVAAIAGFSTIGVVACKVDVISGDDGEGGQGGAGVSSSYVSTSATGLTNVSTYASTGPGSTTFSVTSTITGGPTTGSGVCPPDAQWPSDCATVGATAAGTGGGLKYCFWQQQDCGPNPEINIECDEATGLCTCTGSGEACSCDWTIPPEMGYCGTPCCGGTPNI